MFSYKHEYRDMSTCRYMCIIVNRDSYNSVFYWNFFVMMRHMKISKAASAALILLHWHFNAMHHLFLNNPILCFLPFTGRPHIRTFTVFYPSLLIRESHRLLNCFKDSSRFYKSSIEHRFLEVEPTWNLKIWMWVSASLLETLVQIH